MIPDAGNAKSTKNRLIVQMSCCFPVILEKMRACLLEMVVAKMIADTTDVHLKETLISRKTRPVKSI